jgi:hypothetical protein
MNDRIDKIKTAISGFSELLPLISELPPDEFEIRFHEKLNRLNGMSLEVPEQRRELMGHLYKTCWEERDIGKVQYRSRYRPLGYPGDHLIIDWIYTQRVASTGEGKLWDEFYHRQAAPQAVRNRKTFFCETFLKLLNEYSGSLSVLNIASGPCRDIAEALEKVNTKTGDILFHCVDMDKNAIAYAKVLLNGASAKATFKWEAANAFKLRPAQKYDLVWSAGLFDYLEDRYAIALLARMWKWTKDGGSVIVGNFHPRNPSRNYMEWCGDWFLIHRTEPEMVLLCEQAGIRRENICFDQEPLGVNIFCRGRKG